MASGDRRVFCQEQTVWILEVPHCGEVFPPCWKWGDTVASDVIIPGLESIEWTRAREEPEGCASLALISAQIGVAWKWLPRIEVKFREALRT